MKKSLIISESFDVRKKEHQISPKIPKFLTEYSDKNWGENGVTIYVMRVRIYFNKFHWATIIEGYGSGFLVLNREHLGLHLAFCDTFE